MIIAMSHLNCTVLSSSPLIFYIIQFELKVFENFADVILLSAFLALYEITLHLTKYNNLYHILVC